MKIKCYYEVRGQRTIYKEGKDGTIVRVGVTPDKHLRFASIFQNEANAFATDIFRSEKIVCEVFEVDR